MIPLLLLIFVFFLVGRRQRGDRARICYRPPVLNESDDGLAQREVVNCVFGARGRPLPRDYTVVKGFQLELETACIRDYFTNFARLDSTCFTLDELDGRRCTAKKRRGKAQGQPLLRAI